MTGKALEIDTARLKAVPRASLSEDLSGILSFRRDPIAHLGAGIARHGDIFRFRVLGIPLIFVNHPDFVHHVLVENDGNYDKNGWLYRVLQPVLRDGLIGNPGGEAWRSRRRIMNPPFLPGTVPRFARLMVEETGKMLDRWDSGGSVGQTLDFNHELGALVLRIMTRSLFSTSIEQHIVAVQRAFHEASAILADFFRFPFVPLSVPTTRHRRLRRLIQIVDDTVAYYVNERLSSPQRQEIPDLLSMMMAAVDGRTGEPMSVQDIKDEVLNVGVGAYETTSSSLAWIFYLLARHPDVESKLLQEVDDVCADRQPTFDDLARLRYTRMVIDETLRLYSPAWQTMRRAIAADAIGEYHIPANGNLYLNNYLLHRHPAFWDAPEDFRPERFAPDVSAGRQKNAYVPFGAGPRMCLGKHFALMELQLVVATISQRFRFRVPDGARPVVPEPLIMLHPKGGVRLIPQRRVDP